MTTAEGYKRELCYKIATYANDLGHQGIRIMGITIIEPKTGSDDPIPTFIFTIDDGPTSGTTIWEDRN